MWKDDPAIFRYIRGDERPIWHELVQAAEFGDALRARDARGALDVLEGYLEYLRNVVDAARGGHVQPLYGVGGEARLDERIEAGLPGYEVRTWYALWAVKGTPQSAFHFRWIMGCIDDAGAALEKAKKFSLVGVAEKITCPFIIVHAGEDTVVPVANAPKLFEAIASKDKHLKILSTEDGGNYHAQADNRQVGIDYITKDRVQVKYEMPLAEMVFDFFDRLKSCTRGYASMDYELADYREGDMVKLDILLNGDQVDALSVMIHRSKAAIRARSSSSAA